MTPTLRSRLADTVQQAYTGTGRFEGQQLPMMRAMASLYANMVQIVTPADSGIDSLADLAGKRVSVGAPGSGTEVNAQTMLEANGMSFDDFTVAAPELQRDGRCAAQRRYRCRLLERRRADIVDPEPRHNAGHPHHSLYEEEIAAARAAEPVFAALSLAGGIYNGVGR